MTAPAMCCGRPAAEVCYQRGATGEKWFCGARKHGPEVRALAARGWLTQSATVAASATGAAVRHRLQIAGAR